MKTKRILSIVLTLAMLLGMFPGMNLTASAAGTTKTITPGTDDAKTGTGTMTITLIIKGDPAATDFDVTLPTSLAYDGKAKTATAAAKSAVTGMGTITVEYYKGGTKVDSAVDVGDYTFKLKVADDGTHYNAGTVENADWKFTITKGTPTVTKPTPKTLTYNGQEQELVNAGSATGGTLYYAVTTENKAPNTYTTSIPTATDAGTYYVWYMAVGDDSHSDSDPACITSVIMKVETEVTQADGTPKSTVEGVDSDLAESLMNDEEKALVSSGQTATLTLEMTNIDNTVTQTDKDLSEAAIKKESSGAKVGMYLDLSVFLQVGSNSRRQVTSTGKEISVTMEIPSSLQAPAGVKRTFFIIRIHDGVATKLAETTGTSITLKSSEFSTYVLAYTDGTDEAAGFYSGLKITQKKGKIKVSWDKTEGVSKYGVFITYCGKDYPKKAVKTTKNNSVTFKKINGKKIDFTKNIKIYVEAFDNGGASVGKSISGHVAGKNSTKTKNPKSISVSNKNLTLSTGATSKIKATVKMEKGNKKAFKEDHVAKLRYRSTDVNVARVDKNGKVTAVGAGTCKIYVYAQNGLAVKVSVTVN